jgi:hypothetical protein
MAENIDNIQKRGTQRGKLEEKVAMWPTPRAKEPGRTTKGYGRGLRELVEGKQQMMPTPTARDWKDAGPNVNYEKAKKKGRLAGHSGGSLNPAWVEWLMGYPKGWTDLNH